MAALRNFDRDRIRHVAVRLIHDYQSVAEQNSKRPIGTNGFDRADQGGCYGGVFGKEDRRHA